MTISNDIQALIRRRCALAEELAAIDTTLEEAYATLTGALSSPRPPASAPASSWSSPTVAEGPVVPSSELRTVDRRDGEERRTSRQTRDDEQILGYLRTHGSSRIADMLQALTINKFTLRRDLARLSAEGQVVITGQTNNRRVSLPGDDQAPDEPPVLVTPQVPPLLTRAAVKPEIEPELETAWRPHRDAPSLTGSAPGLGSTLAGSTFKAKRTSRAGSPR